MRRIAKKLDLMNTITVNIWTQVRISSNLEPANLVFSINLQENISKREILIVQVEFGKLLASKGRIIFCERLNGKFEFRRVRWF